MARLTTLTEVANANKALGDLTDYMDKLEDVFLNAGIDPDGFAEFLMDYVASITPVVLADGMPRTPDEVLLNVLCGFIAGIVSGARAVRGVYDAEAVGV